MVARDIPVQSTYKLRIKITDVNSRFKHTPDVVVRKPTRNSPWSHQAWSGSRRSCLRVAVKSLQWTDLVAGAIKLHPARVDTEHPRFIYSGRRQVDHSFLVEKTDPSHARRAGGQTLGIFDGFDQAAFVGDALAGDVECRPVI